MKLRTAYFCRKCDEEIGIETLEVKRKCPHCGYEPDWGKTSVVYQWKVEDKVEKINKNKGVVEFVDFLKKMGYKEEKNPKLCKRINQKGLP